MATDLSSVIKETLYSTLEITLSNPIIENNIFTCNQDCLNDKNIIVNSSTYTFENLTTNIKFIYPAYFASYVFNTMMMEDTEPVLEVDDDIADAIKEVTAQISGSIELAINGVGDASLGTCKFSAGDAIIESGDNYFDVSNLIMINFTNNDREFELFINFEDEFLPYVDEFLSSELKTTEIAPLVAPTEEEKADTENDKDNSEETSDDSANLEDESTSKSDTESSKEDENKKEPTDEENDSKEEKDSDAKNSNDNNSETNENEEELENDEEKKEKLLKKIIIIVAGLLVVILLAFTTMFFTGFFDAPAIIVQDKNITKPSPHDLLLANIKNKQISYKSDMINIRKLNKRLSILTKYEILESDILEEYKKIEKERLYKLKMASLEEFALKNKEEALFNKDLVQNKNLSSRFDDSNKSIKYKNENEIVTLIKIDALIYNKYSKIINSEKTKSTMISMCKNKKDKTMVFIGPLYIKTLINNIVSKVGKKDAKLITIKRKEFDSMCDF